MIFAGIVRNSLDFLRGRTFQGVFTNVPRSKSTSPPSSSTKTSPCSKGLIVPASTCEVNKALSSQRKQREPSTDIEIRINLDGSNLKPHGFEQQAGRGCDDPLPDAAHASSRDKYVFHDDFAGPGPCQGEWKGRGRNSGIQLRRRRNSIYHDSGVLRPDHKVCGRLGSICSYQVVIDKKVCKRLALNLRAEAWLCTRALVPPHSSAFQTLRSFSDLRSLDGQST